MKPFETNYWYSIKIIHLSESSLDCAMRLWKRNRHRHPIPAPFTSVLFHSVHLVVMMATLPLHSRSRALHRRFRRHTQYREQYTNETKGFRDKINKACRGMREEEGNMQLFDWGALVNVGHLHGGSTHIDWITSLVWEDNFVYVRSGHFVGMTPTRSFDAWSSSCALAVWTTIDGCDSAAACSS